MAFVPIRIYKKCFLASFVSILGTVFLALGIGLLAEDVGAAIACAIGGILLMVWASDIAKRKQFKQWIKQLTASGIVAQLADSRELCLQMYKANPSKRTIRFIAQHNPSVAEELAAQKK